MQFLHKERSTYRPAYFIFSVLPPC